MPLLLRILYFFLFGWWATGVWINVAWFLNATIIGLPLGLWMLNRVPQVLTLRPTSDSGSPRSKAEWIMHVDRMVLPAVNQGSTGTQLDPHQGPAPTPLAAPSRLLCA